MEYRICTECEIHHYENCPNCLGFGIRAIGLPEGDVPIIAAQAHGIEPLQDWLPCPECGSTPMGVPAKMESE